MLLGHYSDAALGSMQVSGPLLWSVFSVFGAFGAGTLAVIGRATGAGDLQRARRTMRAVFSLAMAVGTVVALLCHNNDIGDGWEREAENEAYFREFSEKRSYPLGINVVTYALTH